MEIIEYTRTALDKVAETVGQGAVHMVNLVRYREQADYGGRLDLPACSGRDAYFGRYAPAFRKIAEGEDYGVFWVGSVLAVLVGAEQGQWDDIVIVRYSSFATLRRILDNPAYEALAAPHRRAALADWRFVVTTQLDAPR
jgi:hypothetical protein